VSERIKLDIVTPYGSVFSDEVEEATATGTEGEFGVLAGHAPFLTTLRPGRFTCVQEGRKVYFFVGSGFSEVGPDKIMVLADSAEKSEDIDVERAHEAKKRAEDRMQQQEKIDFSRAESALERALARIRVAEHRGEK